MLVHYDEAFKESIMVLPIMDVNEYEVLKEVGEGGFFGCLLMAKWVQQDLVYTVMLI
jgi:hypothetical protein